MGRSPLAAAAAAGSNASVVSAPRKETSTTASSWRENSDMITAASFLPPSAPNPRPWHRVAVPATNPRLGDQLQSQGLGSRKRARAISFVGAWGDASWDAKGFRNVPDGKQDLVKARVSVTAAKEAIHESPVTYNTKRGSFEEESLTWVPRKRHNSRWPIQPPKNTAPMLAEMQPLVEFEVPTADLEAETIEPVVEPVAEPVDDKKTRRRSTRRLSRRLSLAPIEENLDEVPEACSPVKATPYYASPLKRSTLRRLSPTKVAMSPVKEFTISATPSKVMMGRPDFRAASPLKSPTKGTALDPIVEAETASADLPADIGQPSLSGAGINLPILFDQPLPEVASEPQYETRRRVSLSNARRSGRRSSGVERLLNFETQKAPNRRHSFMPQDSAASNAKGRRHTLDIFNIGTDHITVEVTSPEEEKQKSTIAEPAQLGETTASSICPQDIAVDVDVRTNLDIFGSSPVMHTTIPRIPTDSIAERMASSPIKAKVASITDEPIIFNCEEQKISSSTPDALGITHEGHRGEAASEQAATTTSTTSPHKETLPTSDKEISEPKLFNGILETSKSDPASPISETHLNEDPDPSTNGHDMVDNMAATFHELSPVIEEPESPSSAHDGDQSILSPEVNLATAPTSTEDDSFSEADETMSDLGPDDDISTALRIDAYNPTVAMDLDLEHTGDIHVEETADAGNDSFMVKLQFDASSEMAVNICKGEQAILPGTPPQEQDTSKRSPLGVGSFHTEAVPETPLAESPGFKPINAHQRSVSKSPSPPIQEVAEPVDEDDIDMGLCDIEAGLDDDVTMTIELEVEAPVDDSTRLSLHDDSETEMLRQFVTRVKADKDAKAAAVARAKSRPKRRSGSTGSITSATGSPISKTDSMTVQPSQRRPLGEKDLNQSPSPSKKRKPRGVGDVDFIKENDRLGKPALDDTSPPRPKRRRKRMEVETDSVFNPDMDPTQDLTEKGSVRRSTRTRQTRIPLKPTAPSANGALSLIPVRLPGSSGMMQDLEIGPVSGPNLASRHRNEEKDLATVTRVNTRKNKGSAVPPRAVLALQMDDPTAWKMREVRSVHNAREARSGGDGEEGRVVKMKKGVRWDDVLARTQGEDGTEMAIMSTVTITRVKEVKELEVDLSSIQVQESEILEPTVVVEEKVTAVEPPKEVVEVEKPDKKAPVRRTRASKLQPPKAVTKPSAIPPRPTTPAPGAQPKSVAKTGTAAGSMARMATRRTKVPNLGMSGNGTPAPKRQTRA